MEQIKENSKAVWGKSPAGWVYGNNFEKGSKEFFEAVLAKRFSHECPWMFDVVSFEQFKNKKVLEIGCGAGYDAYQFCRAGAEYTGIDLTPQNKVLTEKHLSYYGFTPTIYEMDVEKMEFEQEFDFVFSFGVLHHTPNIEKSFSNIFKALKPGGECQVIVYNKYSIFYLFNTVMTEWLLRGGFLKRSLAQQRSFIERSESDNLPLVNVYSHASIKKMLKKQGFKITGHTIRKLVRGDLKSIKFFGRPAKYFPDRIITYLANRFGWYVSVKACKP